MLANKREFKKTEKDGGQSGGFFWRYFSFRSKIAQRLYVFVLTLGSPIVGDKPATLIIRDFPAESDRRSFGPPHGALLLFQLKLFSAFSGQDSSRILLKGVFSCCFPSD